MSQYPSPYQPPTPSPYTPGYYGAWSDGLGQSRAAGLMLIILGSLGIALSLCMAGVGAMMQQLIESQPNIMQETGGMSADMLKVVMLVVAALSFLFALAFIILGVFVRKGGMVSTILALVLVALVELYCVFNLFVSFGRLGSMSGPPVVGAACAMFVPPLLFGVLIYLLIGALGASRRASSARAQQQAQMWQYQQMQQAYGQQAGYGYPQQPQPGQPGQQHLRSPLDPDPPNPPHGTPPAQ